MRFKVFKNTVLLFVLVFISCGNKVKPEATSSKLEKSQAKDILNQDQDYKSVVVGANKTEEYLPLLEGKSVGIVANQTSVIFKNNSAYTHVVDSLLNRNIHIKKVFAPEHGFRGTADAGEVIKDGIDTKTGLPIVSLYGNNKKPSVEQLKDLDIVVFDIQDVGARFYTYISSLHYVMEACAEQNIPILILDRPNPNGHYIDGPILEPEHKSFVGMHPVPVVHGMTIAEYAKMINGEGWLKNEVKCELKIIPVENYKHQTAYSLPIKPSPNLPNDTAINLYPSLCFFEATTVSVGRGTDKQFQIVGSPNIILSKADFEFTPQPNEGSKYPKHQGKVCYGYDLSKYKKAEGINLKWLIEFYNFSKESENTKDNFFTDFFTTLAGTKKLQQQIEAGFSAKEITASWKKGLKDFATLRDNYLIYD